MTDELTADSATSPAIAEEIISLVFMGVWLGGFLYDRTGSYDLVWYIAIGLGVLAALVNLPIKEAAIAREPLPQGS